MARARARRASSAPGRGRGAPPALSPERRRLFVALTLALPWALLLLLELGLRLGGYGGSYPLFVPYPEQPAYRFVNQQVARRWFRDGPFTPAPRLDFFRAAKAPRAYRIFFQGESSAAGFPYGHGGAPSRMLEQRLQATFPDREIEVVNTALTAINSYALLDQADELAAERPDAVLIYTGHNEYYGVLGAASTRALGGRRPLVLAYLALRRLRTVQLLERAMGAGAGERAAAGARDADDAPRTVMELMAGDQLVPLGAPLYDRGLAQFRDNLDALLARYRKHGIPVFIGTVASNERDQPPFVSAFAPGADSVAWRRAYRAGLDALLRGDAAAAERALGEATRLDSTAAVAFYALGQVHDERGDSARARAAYRAAKDRDALRFRAPEAVNAIVREVAARHGATVVETQRAIERASPGGVPGRTLILEHLHPNVDGYFLIADAFYEALRATGAIGHWDGAVPAARARKEIPVTALDSMVGVFRTDRLVSGWPFRPRGATVVPIVDTLHPRNAVERLARGVVLGTVPWPQAMELLRAEYEKAGDPDRAIRVARAMAQEYRYSAQPYMDAARIALAERRYDEGLRYARAANARRETANSAQLVGLLLLRQGDHAAAMPYLQRAARLAPGDPRKQLPVRAAEALPTLERRRATAPRDTTVLFDLANAYALTQQYDRAREALGSLQRVSPRHAGAAELLSRLPK